MEHCVSHVKKLLWFPFSVLVSPPPLLFLSFSFSLSHTKVSLKIFLHSVVSAFISTLFHLITSIT